MAKISINPNMLKVAPAKKEKGIKQPPSGGYISMITSARIENYNGRDFVVVTLDIVDGEFKNYFTDNLNKRLEKNQNAKSLAEHWVKIPIEDDKDYVSAYFNYFLNCIKECNPNKQITLDTDSFQGSLIGMVLRRKEREYDNRRYMQLFVEEVVTLEEIDTIEPPEDIMLKANKQTTEDYPF